MKHMWSEEEIQTLIEEQGGSGTSTLENIVDKNGNKRFIEGTPNFVLSEGYNVVSVYEKWSLSGTHLMIVGVLTANGNSNLSSKKVYEITLPNWIFSKIVTFPNSVVVSRISALASNTSASMTALLNKDVQSNILYVTAPTEVRDGVTYRIQFDLLVDNE